MNFLRDQRVLVLGLGDSGLAMARWAARCGAADVRVADTREAPPQAARLSERVPSAVLRAGAFTPDLLDGMQWVFKSPGLSPLDPAIAPLLDAAAERGLQVLGELTLFAHALRDLQAAHGYAPKVLAITGTNGKTTTTSMTALLAERAGATVAMAGNIGPTMLDTLADALDLQVFDVPAAPGDAPLPGGTLTSEAATATATEAEADSMSEGGATDTADTPEVLTLPAADETSPVQAASALQIATSDAATNVTIPSSTADAASEVPPALDTAAADAVVGTASAEPSADVDSAVPAVGGSSGPDGVHLAALLDATPADAASVPAVEPETAEAAQARLDDAAFEEVMESAGGPPPHLIPPPPPAPTFEHLPEVWVLELSSFQLDGVKRFEPTAAAVLNVTQDHLDWHGNLAAYAEAKQRIFGQQAVMVVNRDDPAVEAMTVPPPDPVVLNRQGKPRAVKGPKPVPRRITRFGLELPRAPGDFGLVVENGMAWLVRAHPADETIKRRKDDAEEVVLQRLMPADALRVRGRHNAANALAALALTTAAGLPLAPMLHGLREYAGEPHRVEFLRLLGGVEFYDDSKGTNVGATVAALTGLGADKAPGRLVVILGGDGKGQDFSPLAQPVALYARAVALIGRDAAAIRAALGSAVVDTAADIDGQLAQTAVGLAVPHATDGDAELPAALQAHSSLESPAAAVVPAAAAGAVDATPAPISRDIPAARFDTLEAAMRWCARQARPGDAVLLSPACASLDMFRNYGHRAAVFIAAVDAWAEEQGELA